MAVRDISLNEALPDNLDAERFVLGAIMSNDTAFLQVAGTLAADDFNLEKHKRIFLRMSELHERGERIDRVTLANELMKHGQLQSVDGLSYLVSLDDGLPTLHNLDSYVTIVKEKALLRRIISVSQDTINRCLTNDDDAKNILGAVEDAFMKLGDVQSKNSLASPAQIITEYEGGINAFLDTSKRIKGTSTGFLKFDELTGGLREGELFILAARPAMGKCLAADSEIVLSDGTVQTIQKVYTQGKAELLTLEEHGRLGFASPSAFVDDGVKPVFRVTTRLGRTVDSTLPHPFLTFGGWQKLVDLKPGDSIAVPRTMPVVGRQELLPEHAKLLGYLLGDGCLTESTPEFTNADPRLRDEFADCLQVFEGIRFQIEDSQGTRTPTVCVAADRKFVFEERALFAAALTGALGSAGLSDRSLALKLGVSPSLVCQWKQARCVPVGDTSLELCRALGVSSEELFPKGAAAVSQNSKNALTLWLEALGLWGKSAAHKFVPEVVFSSTREGVATFLNRLFATDGWASILSTGQVELGFATVSERLARQVQHLLLRFGIIASLRRKSVLYSGVRRRAWQLDITDAESICEFVSEVGMFGKEKAIDRVRQCLAKKRLHNNRDLLPKDVWKEIELAKGDLSWAEISRLVGVKTPRHNLHVGTREVSRRRLLQFAQVLGSERLRAIATSDLYWDRIVSIEYLGQKQVYDLTIPETHNFIANDICVHNTALALNIAQHIAESPKNPRAVAVFSLEMSKESLLTRMVCASARVDQQRFRAGYLNADERHSLQASMYRMVEAPLFLDDTAGTNLMDVHSKLRRLQAEQDVGLVIIDYLQLMQGRGRFENRVQEISSLSRGLKLMSKELRVPFLVLSQLSRAPETRPGDHRPMLSDLRESGCLAGDTLIPIACTGKRIPIRELTGKQGYKVWALNEQTLRLEPAIVASSFSTGEKPVFELRTQLGRKISATQNHPFRTFSGWKRLDQLVPGEYLALPRVVPGGSTQTMREAELALLGHLIGDGCTLPRHVIQYTTREEDLAETVVELASEVFGDEVSPRISRERNWFQVYLSSTRPHTDNVHSAITDWLNDLGIFGLRSWEKRIPPRVFEQPPEAIAIFLRHLWASDGCINLKKTGTRRTPVLYYPTSSQDLGRDLQSLLLRLEINARIKRISQRNKGRDQYHVIITGAGDVGRAIARMGAVGERRQKTLHVLQELLDAHPANTTQDIVPSAIWRDMAALGPEEISTLASSNLYWDRITSITSLGKQEVFDLTVPGHHNFLANDFVVHNSIEQDADLVAFIFREEVYRPDKESLKGMAELILAKQRNGPTGRVKLAFLNRYTKFENLSADTGDEEAPFE